MIFRSMERREKNAERCTAKEKVLSPRTNHWLAGIRKDKENPYVENGFVGNIGPKSFWRELNQRQRRFLNFNHHDVALPPFWSTKVILI